MKHIIALAMAIGLAACASMVDRPLAQRLGMHIDDVIDQIGFPTEERSVGSRKAYTWVRRTTYQGAPLQCEATYEVDAAGIVIAYHWDGQILACSF